MGRMIEGRWTTEAWKADQAGRFQREETTFRGGIEGEVRPGRYHLYVSWACPWAHRTLVTRALCGLEDAITLTVVDPRMGEDGWELPGGPERGPDPVPAARYLREIYAAADPAYTGRVTVPVLWDRDRGTIVNNESREIVRLLHTAFAPVAEHPVDLCPADLAGEVEAAIDDIYEPINNGVYKAGFARTQEAYDEAVEELFAALARWDEVLREQPWMCGDRLTEADIFLFTTMVRFDLVYYVHFKCNLRHAWEHPGIWRMVRRLHSRPEVAATCRFDHIKTHYYWSHPQVNPRRIVPAGPINPLTEGAPTEEDRP